MLTNSDLCNATHSKSLVIYLWRKYKVFSWLYALMYIIFVANSYIGLIWCSDLDRCENFLKTGGLTSTILILNRIVIYLLFALIVFLELLVVIKLRTGYLKNFFNFLDVIILALYLPITILIFTDVLDDTENV